MAFNRLFTVLGATGLGLTMAGAANALIIDDVGLGFGTFLGTWNKVQPPDDIGDMPNPHANGSTPLVGTAILTQHGSLFDIDQFHEAGRANATDGVLSYDPANDGKGFEVVQAENEYTFKWVYYGFPGDPAYDSGGNITSPGDLPVDLYIAVKFSNLISVFRFDLVDPGTFGDGGAFGYLSSSWEDILDNTPSGPLVDHDSDPSTPEVAQNYFELNYLGLANDDCTLSGDNEYNADCMGKPKAVSGVTAYWPPPDDLPPPPEVPEPASMTLLGAGLVGLGYLNRRRKAA